MRRALVAAGAFALAASLVLACGELIVDTEPSGENPASEAGTPPSGVDGAILDGSDPDAAPPAYPPDVVSQCRTVITDGFEPSDWGHTPGPWQRGSSGSATVSRVADAGLVKSGQGAALFNAPGNDFVALATSVFETCPLTIEFWVMRKDGDTGGLIFFELAGPGRTRHLRQFGQFLALDYEDPGNTDQVPTLQVSSSFYSDTYYRVVIVYEVSGKMTVKVGDAPPVLLGASGTDAPATQVRFGALGTTGNPPSSTVLFDDVAIY